MTRNPILNALAAAAYILALTSLFFALSGFMPADPHPVFAISAFLAVFVLSAALMGYFIVLAPLQLLIEGDTKGAVMLFLKTLMAFAVVVLVVFVIGTAFIPAPPQAAL